MAHAGVSPNIGKTSGFSNDVETSALPSLGPDAPVVDAVRSALMDAQQRIHQRDPGARQGNGEDVHQMRTSARRLRSQLRLYRDLIEGDWADRLNQELKWLGQRLGTVRDGDVMLGRLRASAGGLGTDVGPLFTALERRHAADTAALREAFESERYRRLLDQLSEAAEHPALSEEAWEPCAPVLPALAWKSWKRLRAPARTLDLSDADVNYHEVRKRAKFARHSAESVADGLDYSAGNDARRFARRARTVQDVLGEHQDATIACDEIRRIAAEHPGDAAFLLAAGRLLERQAIAADVARTRFFKVWQKLDRKKNSRWMKP